jgi:hypothetical protein
MNDRNIVATQNLLKTLDLNALKDPDVVAGLVRAFGIMQWSEVVYGPDVKFINPGDMASIGQTPDQIAKALVYLSQFKIESYCEIGVYMGGNFLFTSEYLKRFNPTIQCLGVDPANLLFPAIREIIDLSDYMRFVLLTSDRLAGRKFDLVFIDGDHTQKWIQTDYENLGKHAKICMFHDIQDPHWPDAAVFWSELKGRKEKVEFLDDLSNCKIHGIGISHDPVPKITTKKGIE